MKEMSRSTSDVALFVLLLAFLIWVPMPFGSASDASQLPLVIPPLVICAAAAILRASRETTSRHNIWIGRYFPVFF